MHPLAKPIPHVFATCGRAVFQAGFEEHEAIHLSGAGSFTLPSWMLAIAALAWPAAAQRAAYDAQPTVGKT